MIAGEEALFTDIDEGVVFSDGRRIMRYAPIEVMLDGGKSRYQPSSTAGTVTRVTGWKVCSGQGDNGELQAFELTAAHQFRGLGS